MRPVRTISREVFVTPQRLYAGHPIGMVRQSELPSDRKLSDQRLALQTGRREVRSRAIEAYKTTLRLSDVQREILVGSLLGDACLETQNAGRSYRLKIEQGIAHAAYVQHLYVVLRDWVLSPPRSKQVQTRGLTTLNLAFQTVSHPELSFYGELFYRDRRKIVPDRIGDLLTARGLAYWYMDDGSMKSNQSKGVLSSTHMLSIPTTSRD